VRPTARARPAPLSAQSAVALSCRALLRSAGIGCSPRQASPGKREQHEAKPQRQRHRELESAPAERHQQAEPGGGAQEQAHAPAKGVPSRTVHATAVVSRAQSAAAVVSRPRAGRRGRARIAAFLPDIAPPVSARVKVPRAGADLLGKHRVRGALPQMAEMVAEKHRLVTRSDFDGLVCAALLKELDMLDEITFVHPKDVQDGLVELTERDITTNLPYVPGVGLAFDHHESEMLRVTDAHENHVIDPNALSAARVVYDHFGGAARFPRVPPTSWRPSTRPTARSSRCRRSRTPAAGFCSAS